MMSNRSRSMGLLLTIELFVASTSIMMLLATAADMVEPPQAHELAIPRQQRFSLTKFGGKPGGDFLNTHAFEAAVAAIKEAGGGELYVPPGNWLTTGFALTSHMSLFLEHGATVVSALPNHSAWRPRNETCSSYCAVCTCRGKPGSHTSGPGGADERNTGYEPIVGLFNLTDVLITGNNGTIAGQGDLWWAAIKGHGPCAKPSPAKWCALPHGRPHAILTSRSQRVVISNITITKSPFWTIRFWASQQLRATNLTVTATRTR
jgi:polygalacturonase